MNFLEKNFIWIAILGIAIAFTSKSAQDFFKALFSPKDEVEGLPTFDATIDEYKAREYADMLYQAMIVWNGTDEEKIYHVFGMLKNRHDFNMVYNSFGLRQRSNSFGNEGDFITSSKYDLSYWLNDELNASDKKYVLHQFPQLNIF